MKQHPVRAAFEQVAERPSTKFRDDLRAQLLADLVAPTATTTPQTTQEIPVTDTPNPKLTRRRTLLGIAAAVIVAVGVTAIVVSRDVRSNESVPATDPTIDDSATTTTGVPRSDSFIAEAALLTAADIGSSWVDEAGRSYIDELRLQQTLPECAEKLAAHGDLSEIAKSAGTTVNNGEDQALRQTVVIFRSTDDATTVFEALASPAGKMCGLATTSAVWGRAEGDPNASSVALDIAPPTQHGDQQTSFAATTTFSDMVGLSHLVWVQVDRALVRIVVTNSAVGATDPDPNAILETALAIAVESLAAELAAG